jgi:DNA-binding CsgD family transcriptional regulator
MVAAVCRLDDNEPAAIRRVLCASRWILLHSFVSGGRRFLVAREIAPGVMARRALTLRELQIIALAGMGHTNKLVAYALGISPSTVASHLKSAMKKLGVRSRLELIETCAALGGSECGPSDIYPGEVSD